VKKKEQIKNIRDFNSKSGRRILRSERGKNRKSIEK
jgi:ribosomal protein L34